MPRTFDAEKEVTHMIAEIRKYFIKNGTKDTKAIIGISGGKDSTIAAALLVRALGKDRVVGVMMPNGEQKDITDSLRVCSILDIPHYTINIGSAVEALYESIDNNVDYEVDIPQVTTNTPARIRMATLYAVAAMVGGRVINTGNASELYIGYTTKYGDLAGDFAIFQNYYVREILAIGDYLGLPEELVHKAPGDGMSGKTDEDNVGFTYKVLDDYLIEDITPDYKTLRLIEDRHNRNLHKIRMLSIPYIRCQTRRWTECPFEEF